MFIKVSSHRQPYLWGSASHHRLRLSILSRILVLIFYITALFTLTHASASAAYDHDPIYHAYRTALRVTTATSSLNKLVNRDITSLRRSLQRLNWTSQFEFQTFMSIQQQELKVRRRLFKTTCDLTGETARAAFYNLRKTEQPDAIAFHFDIFVEEAGAGAEGLVINYYHGGRLQAAHIWIEIAGARVLIQTVAPAQSTWTNKSWLVNTTITDDGAAPNPTNVFKTLDPKNILSSLVTQLYYTFSGQPRVRAMDKFLETVQCAETEDRGD